MNDWITGCFLGGGGEEDDTLNPELGGFVFGSRGGVLFCTIVYIRDIESRGI